jgi:DNA invertase Pin-like site-specific DNA recombinase
MTNQIFGYARVSTADQDLTIQEAALRAAGATVIRSEKKTGTTTDGRDQLATLIEFARAGDTIAVTRIDRLARSLLDLSKIVDTLKKKGVFLKVTEQNIDTGKKDDAAGKAFLDMLGVFAEFETNLRKERQREGVAEAKRKGVYKGRKATVDADRVKELAASGMGASDIARELKIGRASVYRHLG